MRPRKDGKPPKLSPGKREGRPPIPVNWEMLEKLCAIHCTSEEIESIMGIDIVTLTDYIRRKYKITFRGYFAKHSATGKMSLRRAQYVKAVQHMDTGMLKHLGAQWLGQKDRVDLSNEDGSLSPLAAAVDRLKNENAK